jgi:phage terminase large subunit-like protein
VRAKDQQYRALYEQWIREGWMIETPGDACDYNAVYEHIEARAAACRIVKMGVDVKFQGMQVCTDLTEEVGLEIRAFNNTYNEFTAPCRRLEELIGETLGDEDRGERGGQERLPQSGPSGASGTIDPVPMLRHGGNPILTWMASNVCLLRDRSGEKYRPVKPTRNSPLKVDGIVCLCMGLALKMIEPEPKESIYKKRGIVTD